MQLLIQNARLRGRDGTVDIQIENGRIKRIAPKIEGVQGEIIDARGKLTTPSLIDPHIHLDKVNVFDVVRPNKSGTLKEAIEILWDQKRIYTIDDIVARGTLKVAVPQDFPDITRAKAGIPYRAKATRKDGTKFMSLTPLIFPFSSIPSALWIQKEFTVI